MPTILYECPNSFFLSSGFLEETISPKYSYRNQTNNRNPRLEQNPSKITAEQAQKLSDLYKVSIANLLSEATPVITFKDSNKENPYSGNGYIQTNNIQRGNESELTKAIQTQNELLIKQNAELMELVKMLRGK